MEAAQNLTNFLWYRHRKNLGEDLYAFENGGTGARMDRIWSWFHLFTENAFHAGS